MLWFFFEKKKVNTTCYSLKAGPTPFLRSAKRCFIFISSLLCSLPALSDFSSSPQIPHISASSTVLSAEAFSAAVNKMGQQTQQTLSEETAKQQKNIAGKSPLPTPAPTQASPETNRTPVPQEAQSGEASLPRKQDNPLPSTTPDPNSAANTAAKASPLNSSPDAGAQTYTGFGTSNPSNPAAGSSSSGGGWNIHY